MKAGIALGSNLGDRKNNLLLAIEKLKELHITHPSLFLISSFHETEPLDCPKNSPLFLNAVVQLETTLSPIGLLKRLQSLEVSFGRPKEHSYHSPRPLDLDLLYYEQISMSNPELILPHPRIRERLFVLAPLVEIAPNLILPDWDKTAQEYLLLLNK